MTRKSSIRVACRILIVVVLAGIFMLGCAATPSQPTPPAAPGAEAFAFPDDTFRRLFLALEEQRVEVFTDLLALDCDPPRDILWRDINAFIGGADQIEYVIQVERRHRLDNMIVYVFAWQRKHLDKATDQVLTARGQSEWTLAKGHGDEYLLRRLQGDPVF